MLSTFPDLLFYKQVIPLVASSFDEVLQIPTADLLHKIRVYRAYGGKAPFGGLTSVYGFSGIEGPYPQWNLPEVQWATGRSARATLSAAKLGEGRLIMRARSELDGQSIAVMLDGKPVGTCDLPMPNMFFGCSFAVTIGQQTPVLDLTFSKVGPAAEGEKSVLFKALRLDPAPGAAAQ